MKTNIIYILLAFLLSGCVMEDYGDHCPGPEEDGAGYVTISFNLTASKSQYTRAYDQRAGEWPIFEDHIDIKDCIFFIYADINETSKPLIRTVDMSDVDNDAHTNISGGPQVYTVRISIPKSAVDNAIQEDDYESEISFRIVAFVNTYGKAKSLKDSSEAESFNSLIDEASKWVYNVSETLYTKEEGSGLTFNSDSKIPMYGSMEFKATRSELQNSKPESPIWADNLSLLRSIARIEVIDAISYLEDNGLPRIEAVTFSGSTDRAYMLPESASDYINGDQVKKSNVCSGEAMLISLFKGEDHHWFGYIPEQAIESDESAVPSFTITITYEVGADGSPVIQKEFIVPMTGYKNQEFSFGTEILRNHIYVLSVENINNDDIQAETVVVPYIGIDLLPEFGFDNFCPGDHHEPEGW